MNNDSVLTFISIFSGITSFHAREEIWERSYHKRENERQEFSLWYHFDHHSTKLYQLYGMYSIQWRATSCFIHCSTFSSRYLRTAVFIVAQNKQRRQPKLEKAFMSRNKLLLTWFCAPVMEYQISWWLVWTLNVLCSSSCWELNDYIFLNEKTLPFRDFLASVLKELSDAHVCPSLIVLDITLLSH
jgi:hypothetical protein